MGVIHTDSKDKIITVLLYLNRDWPHTTGRLRLLRNGQSLDDYAVEIPPDNGTLLVFKRSNNLRGMAISRSMVHAEPCK